MPSTDFRPAVLIAIARSDALRSLLASIQTRDFDAAIVEDMRLEDIECFLIREAMTRSEGNVSQSAKALGLSRSALYRRLQRYGL